MKHLWDNCLEYFETNEAKRNFHKCVLTPLGVILYQEFYLYVWIICFYHIFLILMVFGILILLVRLDPGANIPISSYQ
jgi:hypothetical protein